MQCVGCMNVVISVYWCSLRLRYEEEGRMGGWMKWSQILLLVEDALLPSWTRKSFSSIGVENF